MMLAMLFHPAFWLPAATRIVAEVGRASVFYRPRCEQCDALGRDARLACPGHDNDIAGNERLVGKIVSAQIQHHRGRHD